VSIQNNSSFFQDFSFLSENSLQRRFRLERFGRTHETVPISFIEKNKTAKICFATTLRCTFLKEQKRRIHMCFEIYFILIAVDFLNYV
jgi:hypothetical protein